jgi:magnesium-transporting ATPase (P-type)
VVATGDATELGAIAGMMRTEEDLETPLQQRMKRFAHHRRRGRGRSRR